MESAMTFDEVSMERSKSFVFALQELKNLRPQLYSAAEYCEKSYLHSDQKQMVLENLKDYAVRALVNAVDHLGTVAYKLTNLLEQQTLDVSTMDLKISTLNQKLDTCQTYTDNEGLRQQQLLAFIPRHHKHYILPNNNEDSTLTKPSATQSQLPNGVPTPSAAAQTLGVMGRDVLEMEGFKPKNAFGSFDNGNRHKTVQVPSRSKSVLSSFFVKQKAAKLRTGSLS
ncbi:hypothetical protein SESBI_18610 [Sesbania bispinosa]|nr:hypothetical protein SESBI_18610 [Sesbania bispinosa]